LTAVLVAFGLASSALAANSGGVATGAPGTTTTTTSTSSYPTLRYGASGHWVTVLQEDLAFAGYSTPIDGQFGANTKRSVNSFKRAHKLWPNGVFQAMAWTRLVNAVKAAEASVPAGERARLNPDGLVTAPAGAPQVVKQVIAAANQIATLPYCYGGGHGSWKSSCYDCSGSVGYALHGGGLLSVTEDSGEMESYGAAGPGKWITLYMNAGHVYAKIAGLWFDTAAQSSSNGNDRWSKTRISPASGFMVRHPIGY
jgi:peptidoglycan hydrolase-like protein with peptidoglycan-binding domain